MDGKADYRWVPVPNSDIRAMTEEPGAYLQYPFITIFFSILMWTAFYFTLQHYNWRKSAEWNCRVVTFVHGALVSSFSIYSSFIIGPNPLREPGGPNTPMQLCILSICLGYFTYDLIWCLYHQTEGPLMMVHHVASILCLLLPLYLGVSGAEVVVSIGCMEITNPILQIRWFLRETGYKKTISAIIIDFIFITMFFMMRMVFGTYLHYAVVSSKRPHVIIKVGGTIFLIISWLFMYAIAKYVYRKYILKGKPKAAKEKIEEEEQHTGTTKPCPVTNPACWRTSVTVN